MLRAFAEWAVMECPLLGRHSPAREHQAPFMNQ